MSSALRAHLTEDLAKTVRQAGVVVWQDDHHEYASVARSMCPPEVKLAVFGGSWYALRRDVEDLLAAETAPQLIVYASSAPPADDPLAEIRAAGKEFKSRLPTLVRNALAGRQRQRLQRLLERIVDALQRLRFCEHQPRPHPVAAAGNYSH